MINDWTIFFAEKSIAAQSYLIVQIEFVAPQMEEYQPSVIFKQHVHCLIGALKSNNFN